MRLSKDAPSGNYPATSPQQHRAPSSQHHSWHLRASRLAILYYLFVHGALFLYLLSYLFVDAAPLSSGHSICLVAASFLWLILARKDLSQLANARHSATLMRLDTGARYVYQPSSCDARDARSEALVGGIRCLSATPWCITIAVCETRGRKGRRYKKILSPYSETIRHLWRDQLCTDQWRFLISYLALEAD